MYTYIILKSTLSAQKTHTVTILYKSATKTRQRLMVRKFWGGAIPSRSVPFKSFDRSISPRNRVCSSSHPPPEYVFEIIKNYVRITTYKNRKLKPAIERGRDKTVRETNFDVIQIISYLSFLTLSDNPVGSVLICRNVMFSEFSPLLFGKKIRIKKPDLAPRIGYFCSNDKSFLRYNTILSMDSE